MSGFADEGTRSVTFRRNISSPSRALAQATEILRSTRNDTPCGARSRLSVSWPLSQSLR